uniref:WAT1-related protein n=1 Tax=Lotus japonicus TaxID=34305 RepID=I3SPB3_LOTJA|nr:unknown [Lotus japonicus]
MTLYKGPQVHLFHNPNTTHQESGNHSTQSHQHWIAGTLFIGLGCLAWSSFYILQSITIRRYPAELSLSSLICLVGAMESAVVALVAEHRSQAWTIGFDTALWPSLHWYNQFGYSILCTRLV